MKYVGMPWGMWLLFSGSFKKHLTSVLKYETEDAKKITGKAGKRYKTIIAELPDFEKGNRFKMNTVNCAMLSAFLLNLPSKPSV